MLPMGLYRDNGKSTGSYYNGDYIGLYRVYIQLLALLRRPSGSPNKRPSSSSSAATGPTGCGCFRILSIGFGALGYIYIYIYTYHILYNDNNNNNNNGESTEEKMENKSEPPA